jgi:hypothetical protein
MRLGFFFRKKFYTIKSNYPFGNIYQTCCVGYLELVNWLYIMTCKKCGYISTEKLPELKAKEMIRSHIDSSQDCTRGHVKLVRVRA